MKTIEVVCGVAVKGSQLFMARRKAGKSYAGHWEFPGGKVESGQDHKTALARELKEELGVNVKVGAFIATGKAYGQGFEINLHGYTIHWEVEPKASSDHDQMGWKGVHEFPSLSIPEADWPILNKCLESLL